MVTVSILSFGPFIAMVRNIILAYQLGAASPVFGDIVFSKLAILDHGL